MGYTVNTTIEMGRVTALLIAGEWHAIELGSLEVPGKVFVARDDCGPGVITDLMVSATTRTGYRLTVMAKAVDGFREVTP